MGLGVLLVGTALLYLWNLSASGWANSFYSAAAQAGADNWTAMLFGSSDAANAITVDKIPASLWIMDLSVRIFGLNSWSVLAPQALEGVAAVALLYAAVRRVRGPGAALLAGAVMALTPVAALIFRFNNPDALLVLALVAGAYCTQRACEKDSSRWWLVAAGATIGFGFLAKMLQAFLVLPGFIAAYVAAGNRPLGRRLLDVASMLAAMVVSAGWYLALVEIWPSESRPYIGGSQHDSIVELALGYNGIGRLTGDEPGGLGNLNFDVGWGRLFGHSMGADIAWLLPAAVICLGAIVVFARRSPRSDPLRAAALIWGGWLLVTAVVFSFMSGIVHPYYTVALAPAVAALVGIGATLLWQNRSLPPAATALAGTVLVTSVLACVLLTRAEGWLPWLRAVIAIGGVATATLLLVAGRLRRQGRTIGRRFGRHGVAGRTVRVFRCHSGNSAYRLDTVGWPVGPWLRADGAGRPVERPDSQRRHDRDTLGRRRRLHVGRGGAGFEQRGGLPVGHRRAGDGCRWFQRNRPGAHAEGVQGLRQRQEDPLLHPRPDDVRPMGRSHLVRQSRSRRHRAVGGDPFRPDDVGPRHRLRPHPAAEEHIAQT